MSKKSYQQLRTELDEVLRSMQDSDDIEASMKQFEEGMKIIKQLEDYLADSEVKIKKIKGQLKD